MSPSRYMIVVLGDGAVFQVFPGLFYKENNQKKCISFLIFGSFQKHKTTFLFFQLCVQFRGWLSSYFQQSCDTLTRCCMFDLHVRFAHTLPYLGIKPGALLGDAIPAARGACAGTSAITVVSCVGALAAKVPGVLAGALLQGLALQRRGWGCGVGTAVRIHVPVLIWDAEPSFKVVFACVQLKTLRVSVIG